MTLVEDGFSSGQVFRPFPRLVQDAWRSTAHQRLDHALESAMPVPIDDASRIVFLSDCHRGDGTSVDAFARNKAIYLAALAHYWTTGFTYIEVGDGDELWQNGRFDDILHAHRDVFARLHQFHDDGRLYLLVGNHDTYGGLRYQAEKDGMLTYHSLRLAHQRTGQELLVAHGHQADMTSSRHYALTRMVCRSLWRWVQSRGLVDGYPDLETTAAKESATRWRALGSQGKRIEQRIIEWVQTRRVPIICGHTHLPALPSRDAPPYFNCGSCVTPGSITALELTGNQLSLVRWTAAASGRANRHLMAQPRPLAPGAAARAASVPEAMRG